MNFLRLSTQMLKCLKSVKMDTMAGGVRIFKRCAVAGVPGSGVGKGGGAGGAVKESGGGLGKMGAAREDSFFYDKTKEQLRDMKRKLELEKKASPPDEKKQK